MARRAYPDIPLFRYEWTDLSGTQITQKLASPALAGPDSKAALEDIGTQKVTFIGDDGTRLEWSFSGGKVSLGGGAATGYGALTQGHVTLIAHLLPAASTGYVLAWDTATNRASVVEIWFGGGPAPMAREVNREVYSGYVDTGSGEPAAEPHKFTNRIEGRAISWKEDTGNRTVDYYPSASYSHWVELDRMEEGRGYSAPSDYIRLTEDLYLYTRTESEFSGMMHLFVMDMNRLEQAGLRIGFNGLDELEYYMFRGTGEWLGQLARFEQFGDVTGNELADPDRAKGERQIYRPFATMDKMSREEVAKVVAENTEVFAKPSAMAGNGLPPSENLSGKSFAVQYDGGAHMEYRFDSHDSLQWREGSSGSWVTGRYNAWESMPGVFIFGHVLEGSPDHDGHVVVADLETGKATTFRGYLNTPYIANETGCETWFGKILGADIPDPGADRHERTKDMLGRAFTWSYSPGLTSMHVYSTPNTTSWVIFTPSGHGGAEWSGSGDFIKIRDQLYFCRWQEEACNGALGTILINMRTMHDSGVDYHCGSHGLTMGPVGAYARHAGKIDVDKFLGDKKGGYAI